MMTSPLLRRYTALAVVTGRLPKPLRPIGRGKGLFGQSAGVPRDVRGSLPASVGVCGRLDVSKGVPFGFAGFLFRDDVL